MTELLMAALVASSFQMPMHPPHHAPQKAMLLYVNCIADGWMQIKQPKQHKAYEVWCVKNTYVSVLITF